jgi:hypothetical protein
LSAAAYGLQLAQELASRPAVVIVRELPARSCGR